LAKKNRKLCKKNNAPIEIFIEEKNGPNCLKARQISGEINVQVSTAVRSNN